MTRSSVARVAAGGEVVLAIWLLVAPFALGYAGASVPFTNDLACSAIVFALAGIRMRRIPRHVGLSWAVAGVGVWLIVAPFILDYGAPNARLNDVATGILVVVLGLASTFGSPKR